MDTKELILWMYTNYLGGKPVYDFGNIQYTWCEKNGLLDMDAYMDFEDTAKQITVSHAILSMKKDKQDQWIETAKLLCLKDLFARIKSSNEPITNFLP